VPAPFPESLRLDGISLHRRTERDLLDLAAAIEVSITELSAFFDWAGNGVPTLDALRAEILERDRAFEVGTGFEYVIRESSSGELVGQAGAGPREDDRAALEVGYWVRTDRVGRGYATQAAGALTTMAFGALPSLARVEIRMDKGNARSRRIPERLGFDLVGEERFDGPALAGQTGEGDIYAVGRAAWLARSKSRSSPPSHT
jgi:RimJ/RimL family protein N-acetyltransferase